MKEIVKWVIISEYEGAIAVFDTEKEALTSAYFVGKTKIVKMVGQIPEQKKMKKVALFVLKNHWGEIFVGDYMQTEEIAKEYTLEKGGQLIQWPYGDVIEVEDPI